MTDVVAVTENRVIGKFWAAIRAERVVALLTMRVPKDVDFDQYREKSRQALELVGEVVTGEIQVTPEGTPLFVKRLNHQNRPGQTVRTPKVYALEAGFVVGG